MTIQILRYAAPIAVILSILGGGSANALSDDTTAMPLGVTTAAPGGFIEMCERAPAECLATARPTSEMLAEVRDWAGRARWASVFQTAGIAPATLPAAIDVRRPTAAVDTTPMTAPTPPSKRPKATTPEDIRAIKDQRRKHGASARPTKAAPAAPAPEPIATASPSRAVADVSVETLEAVSRRFNRAIRRASDADAYGREDVWVLPDGRRPAGDCEDYVLAKRRALIEDGVDPAALSIAIVRTRRGETHAVLLVATPDGERVLDNLSPWVLPWREAPYEWLERQAPGQPRIWISAAT